MEPTAKKKILFVITKSNCGGAQKYVYDLVTTLPNDQFAVTVAFGGTGAPGAPEGLLAKQLAQAGVRTLFLASFARDVGIFREFSAFFELLKLLRVEKPDILHLNSSKAGGLGALAGRITGVRKIVFTAHGWAHREPRSVFVRSAVWLASWVTILLAHRVIAVSHYDYSHAPILFSRKKICTIHNGINLNLSLASGERIRNAFPPGVRITGTIGELTKNKNQVALIEEAKNDPDMYVAIVGEGEDRLYLMKKIEEYGLKTRVQLFGFMRANEVLRGFDVFALPSLKEGLPYVLLEAKAAGLPLAASRVGGVGEILDAKDMSDFSLAQMVKKTVAIYR